MKQKPSNGTFWYVRRAVTQAEERNESVSVSKLQNHVWPPNAPLLRPQRPSN